MERGGGGEPQGGRSSETSGNTAANEELQAMAWELEQETAFLINATGVANLAQATAVQMALDTKANAAAFLGDRMPSLYELRLTNSVIGSLRDLGAALRQLCVLWVGRCELAALDGLTGMPRLRELYAPFNDITDLEPLQSMDCLEVLDLEGNAVSDPEMLYYLSGPPLVRTAPRRAAPRISLAFDGRPPPPGGPPGELTRWLRRGAGDCAARASPAVRHGAAIE